MDVQFGWYSDQPNNIGSADQWCIILYSGYLATETNIIGDAPCEGLARELYVACEAPAIPDN